MATVVIVPGLGQAIANEVAEVCDHIASCLRKPGPGFEKLLGADLDAWIEENLADDRDETW